MNPGYVLISTGILLKKNKESMIFPVYGVFVVQLEFKIVSRSPERIILKSSASNFCLKSI